MHSICYLSNKKESLNEKGLEELFEITQKNNQENNITGTLLYLGGNFLQVIEGDKLKIANLFKKIKTDSRHENIFLIIDKPIEKSVFKNYNSGFSLVRNKEELENLKNYLNSESDNKNLSKTILGILEPFLL